MNTPAAPVTSVSLENEVPPVIPMIRTAVEKAITLDKLESLVESIVADPNPEQGMVCFTLETVSRLADLAKISTDSEIIASALKQSPICSVVDTAATPVIVRTNFKRCFRTTLILRNVSSKATIEDVKGVFEQKVVSVNSDPKSPGFWYVSFESEAAAQQAFSAAQGKTICGESMGMRFKSEPAFRLIEKSAGEKAPQLDEKNLDHCYAFDPINGVMFLDQSTLEGYGTPNGQQRRGERRNGRNGRSANPAASSAASSTGAPVPTHKPRIIRPGDAEHAEKLKMIQQSQANKNQMMAKQQQQQQQHVRPAGQQTASSSTDRPAARQPRQHGPHQQTGAAASVAAKPVVVVKQEAPTPAMFPPLPSQGGKSPASPAKVSGYTKPFKHYKREDALHIVWGIAGDKNAAKPQDMITDSAVVAKQPTETLENAKPEESAPAAVATEPAAPAVATAATVAAAEQAPAAAAAVPEQVISPVPGVSYAAAARSSTPQQEAAANQQ